MPFSNSTAASYGLLVMYAMDTYRSQPKSQTPTPPAGLTATGWKIMAYVTGNDTLFQAGPIQIQPQKVNYGFLLQRGPQEFAVAIRGTDGMVEWIEDGDFLLVPYLPKSTLPSHLGPVAVERGFWLIYSGMTLTSPAGESLGPLAPEIIKAIGPGSSVTVIGHSLGAALATYLTLDLAGNTTIKTTGCFLASPHPGDKAFATLFDTIVPDYRLFNYILDVVPRVPLGLGYEPLNRRTVLQPATAEANIRATIECNHHVVCYAAMLDYEGTMQAIPSAPSVEQPSIACILGPETGRPTIAKTLLSSLAGLAPV